MTTELDMNPLNIPTFWKGEEHQKQALLYWWNQTPVNVRLEFQRMWRNPPPAPPEQEDILLPGVSVIGWERTSPVFRKKLQEICGRLRIEPTWLAACISFETGGTFSPSIKNAMGSGATGLIQFMPRTAHSLGTTTEQLAKMTAEEQLFWVERYLWPYRGRMRTLRDVYMAIFWPAAIGQGPNYRIAVNPSIVYRQNAGLDRNRDGAITAEEAARSVADRIINR